MGEALCGASNGDVSRHLQSVQAMTPREVLQPKRDGHCGMIRTLNIRRGNLLKLPQPLFDQPDAMQRAWYRVLPRNSMLRCVARGVVEHLSIAQNSEGTTVNMLVDGCAHHWRLCKPQQLCESAQNQPGRRHGKMMNGIEVRITFTLSFRTDP